jgi:cytochrome c oxidase cbb3-type subunit 4
MPFEHIELVYFAKTHGLIYLMAFSVAVIFYVYRPSNKKKFDRAANAILDAEDKPCQ